MMPWVAAGEAERAAQGEHYLPGWHARRLAEVRRAKRSGTGRDLYHGEVVGREYPDHLRGEHGTADV